jgi:cytochrome c553
MNKIAFALVAGATLVSVAGSAISEPAKPYEPALIEYMLRVQNHHAKVWLAGNARNWELAEFQAEELEELLEDIAKRIPVYKEIPVGKMIESIAMTPMHDVQAAIKARDSKAFASAYDKLTASCNSCHESSNRGFIVVQRPTSSPFPNQSFAPKRK